jgi:transposase
MQEEIAWFAGIDWATEHHRVGLIKVDGNNYVERQFDHDGTGLQKLCDWLIEKSGAIPAEIAVAIEMPRGPVVEALLERGFQAYAINPKQVDRFRDRFTVAGAKDDSRDTRVLCGALRTDRQAFHRLKVEDPLIIELREWSRMHDELKAERNRLVNQTRQQLWRYYPQAIKLAEGDLAEDWFLNLWSLVPTPAAAARTREAAVGRILKQHRIRRFQACDVLEMLRQKPLLVAPGTTEAAVAHLRALAERLLLVNRQRRDVARQLDRLQDAIAAAAENEPGQICGQRDVAILRSLTGLGRIIIATLLAEASEPLRQRDYHVLRACSGVAPVTIQSGKTRYVIRRYACNERLAEALYQWARVASQHDPTSMRQYAELRAHGKRHGHALRIIGDRLLYLLCTLLKRQTLFDPNYKNQPSARAA